MSDTQTCRACGAPLGSGDEQCPRCLLSLGRANDASGAQAGDSGFARTRKKRAVPTLAEIATHFPELEVEVLIGEGGMGAVYKARQPKIDRSIALKVLALDPRDDPTFAERFRREAMVLARLDHSNVVKLYDFGERDGLYYLVLEFVDGTNLRALMKQGLLTPEFALAVVPQMCEALQFAHDEGIVHRDIKPENVLIDTKGRVKIADFGLAKIVDADPRDVSLTEIGQVMGTPHYMAPEQLRGAAEVDHRADIYSLGVVFYEMLTGELPRGKFDLPSKHLHVDVRLDEIVLKSLERTPERRYQHAIDVKTDVESVGVAPERSRLKSLLDSIPERARKAVVADIAEARVHSDKTGDRVVVVYPNRPWQYFVMFLLVWPLVGSAFNGGLWWFVGAMALVAATFWSLMEREVHARTELDNLLRAEPRGVIAARQLTAIVLLLCGLGALFLGHVALFDDFAINYRSGPNDPQSMHALETNLLPVLSSRIGLAWSIDPSRLEFTRKLFDPLNREEIFHQPWLLLLALGLCIATAAVFGSRWTDLFSWRGWRMPVRTTGSLFGSLLAIHGFCALVHLATHDGAPFVNVLAQENRRVMCGGPLETVSHRLRTILLEHGYATTATGGWSFHEREAVAAPQSMQISFADPPSAFDRWRLTWSGPKRIQPHAVFVVRDLHDEGPCRLECDLGDVPQDSSEQGAWSQWFSSFVF